MLSRSEIRTAANRHYCVEFAAIQAETDPDKALARSLALGAAMQAAVEQSRTLTRREG
jgi:hypothetical protein